MGLSTIAQDPATKASMVDDCTHLIDEQVANKRGMSGMALKTAYRVIKGVGPTYLRGAIGRVLPEALRALEPMWYEGLGSGDPVQYLRQNPSRTAEILLSVTDQRIQNSSGAVVGVYKKLRKSIKSDVEEAVPDLANILGKHAQALSQA
ncbi:MAG: hypothetical protein AAGH67_00820 [Cyanobacteria bacterium P01_H01_bin.162]